MYKTSQDHLELFFKAVWAAGGCNNNPTTIQFTAAYKRLLLRSDISGGKGNCEKRDPIEILSAVTNSCEIEGKTVTLTNAALIRKYDLQERTPVQSEHDYCDLPNVTSISEYKEAGHFLHRRICCQNTSEETPLPQVLQCFRITRQECSYHAHHSCS